MRGLSPAAAGERGLSPHSGLLCSQFGKGFLSLKHTQPRAHTARQRVWAAACVRAGISFAATRDGERSTTHVHTALHHWLDPQLSLGDAAVLSRAAGAAALWREAARYRSAGRAIPSVIPADRPE